VIDEIARSIGTIGHFGFVLYGAWSLLNYSLIRVGKRHHLGEIKTISNKYFRGAYMIFVFICFFGALLIFLHLGDILELQGFWTSQ